MRAPPRRDIGAWLVHTFVAWQGVLAGVLVGLALGWVLGLGGGAGAGGGSGPSGSERSVTAAAIAGPVCAVVRSVDFDSAKLRTICGVSGGAGMRVQLPRPPSPPLQPRLLEGIVPAGRSGGSSGGGSGNVRGFGPLVGGRGAAVHGAPQAQHGDGPHTLERLRASLATVPAKRASVAGVPDLMPLKRPEKRLFASAVVDEVCMDYMGVMSLSL